MHQTQISQILVDAGNAASKGNYNEALLLADKYISNCPNNAATYNLKADFLLDMKRYDEALEVCEKALSIRPEFVSGLINKGNALEGLGRYEEAVEAYQKAILIDPESSATNYLDSLQVKISSIEESVTDQTEQNDPITDLIFKLEQLKDDGDITEEEFELLESKLIG